MDTRSWTAPEDVSCGGNVNFPYRNGVDFCFDLHLCLYFGFLHFRLRSVGIDPVDGAPLACKYLWRLLRL